MEREKKTELDYVVEWALGGYVEKPEIIFGYDSYDKLREELKRRKSLIERIMETKTFDGPCLKEGSIQEAEERRYIC